MKTCLNLRCSRSILENTLIWPAYVAIACCLFRLARIIYHSLWLRRKLRSEEGFKDSNDSQTISRVSYLTRCKDNFERLGVAITVFRFLRLFGILLLVAISVYTFGRKADYQTSQVETIHLVLYVSNGCLCCSINI